ncbi:hypothetical protein MRB53_042076 [Persea americana]|nr:hypothetical protein MRB53_042076 [Persea americana]
MTKDCAVGLLCAINERRSLLSKAKLLRTSDNALTSATKLSSVRINSSSFSRRLRDLCLAASSTLRSRLSRDVRVSELDRRLLLVSRRKLVALRDIVAKLVLAKVTVADLTAVMKRREDSGDRVVASSWSDSVGNFQSLSCSAKSDLRKVRIHRPKVWGCGDGSERRHNSGAFSGCAVSSCLGKAMSHSICWLPSLTASRSSSSVAEPDDEQMRALAYQKFHAILKISPDGLLAMCGPSSASTRRLATVKFEQLAMLASYYLVATAHDTSFSSCDDRSYGVTGT